MNSFTTKNKVIIYTDGACSNNPGVGGWGCVLIFSDEKTTYIRKISGYSSLTTNNQMELQAIISALLALKKPCELNIYSDSAYVVNAFNQNWIENWQKNGWKNAKKEEVSNKDLWLTLIESLKQHNYTFIKVKGHNGDKYNEICDTLATTAITNKIGIDVLEKI